MTEHEKQDGASDFFPITREQAAAFAERERDRPQMYTKLTPSGDWEHDVNPS